MKKIERYVNDELAQEVMSCLSRAASWRPAKYRANLARARDLIIAELERSNLERDKAVTERALELLEVERHYVCMYDFLIGKNVGWDLTNDEHNRICAKLRKLWRINHPRGAFPDFIACDLVIGKNGWMEGVRPAKVRKMRDLLEVQEAHCE